MPWELNINLKSKVTPKSSDYYNRVPSIVFFTVALSSFDVDSVITRDVRIRQTKWIMADTETFRIKHLKISRTNITAMDRRMKNKYHRELKTVFTLNFLPYKPTGACKFKYLQTHHQFYRPEFENYINDHIIIKPPKLKTWWCTKYYVNMSIIH